MKPRSPLFPSSPSPQSSRPSCSLRPPSPLLRPPVPSYAPPPPPLPPRCLAVTATVDCGAARDSKGATGERRRPLAFGLFVRTCTILRLASLSFIPRAPPRGKPVILIVCVSSCTRLHCNYHVARRPSLLTATPALPCSPCCALAVLTALCHVSPPSRILSHIIV